MILFRNISLAVWVAGLAQLFSPSARAQTPSTEAPAADRPTAVILKTASSAELRDLAEAAGRLIRVEVDRAGVVRTEGTPALHLDDLQMALGCLGETPDCLRVVAAELNVQTLLYASLERSGPRLTLTLVYFDGTSSRLATRSVAAPRADNTVLEAVEPLVREVLGLPPRPPATVARSAAAEDTAESRGLRAGAFVAAGVAAVAVGASAFFLRDHQRAERRYREAPAASEVEVDAALHTRSRAESSGRAGVGLVTVAGAASVTAVVLGVLVHVRHPRDRARVQAAVVMGRGELGVTLRGSL